MFLVHHLTKYRCVQRYSITGKCGHPKTDYSPCVTRSQSDVLFRQCCQLYVPEGCHDLCQYEIEEIPARNLDNRKCCHHLNLADNKLGVGDRCLRFCDPAGQGINAITLPIRRFPPFYRGPDVGSCQSKHPVLNAVLNPSCSV
uniref:Bm10296, isoform e n=1 Tax=Brugia malayi TaxID=6279 RepID=A0A0J9XXL9_BRUMA|nr:Bm10296, isoform e [Brugia malayi]